MLNDNVRCLKSAKSQPKSKRAANLRENGGLDKVGSRDFHLAQEDNCELDTSCENNIEFLPCIDIISVILIKPLFCPEILHSHWWSNKAVDNQTFLFHQRELDNHSSSQQNGS